MFLEKPWDQFQERTEWTWGLEDEAVYSFSNGMIVNSLNEEYSTRAERRKLSEREQLFRKWQEDIYPSLSEAFTEKLQRIAEREDNWDGKGSLKPNIVALSKAHITLERFLKAVVSSGRLWKKPFVSSEENGQITVQWNSGEHELHIEIDDKGAEYIKVWGVNIVHEMHVGLLKQRDFLNLWDWLNE
jgi:hypothetical protein